MLPSTDTSKDPRKYYIGKRNCSEYVVELNTPPGVFGNVDYDPDNPPTAPIDPPETEGLDEGSSYAEVINGATIYYTLNADGEWVLDYIDEDSAGNTTTVADLSADNTYDPENPPTAPIAPPADCVAGDSLVEKINGALVFSTKQDDGTWDTFACPLPTIVTNNPDDEFVTVNIGGEDIKVAKNPYVARNCLEGGGIELVKCDGTTDRFSFNEQRRPYSIVPLSPINAGVPVGTVMGEACLDHIIPECGADVSIETLQSGYLTNNYTGFYAPQMQFSRDGGATYIPVASGGGDLFFGFQETLSGEHSHIDFGNFFVSAGTQSLCIRQIVQTNAITAGNAVMGTTSGYVDVIRSRCC